MLEYLTSTGVWRRLIDTDRQSEDRWLITSGGVLEWRVGNNCIIHLQKGSSNCLAVRTDVRPYLLKRNGREYTVLDYTLRENDEQLPLSSLIPLYLK